MQRRYQHGAVTYFQLLIAAQALCLADSVVLFDAMRGLAVEAASVRQPDNLASILEY